ncbi:hypothetical protein LCGC14_0568570 [marine sediment metagenome]|uniref:Uncharacterized protein n=1 Tax=marine sediment metagenome TaxID=412755 RepID=A0A0F9U678_9ZZZZ|nr:hypothetical protein [Phycisphaerae bacterium]
MKRIRQQRMVDDLMRIEREWRCERGHSLISDYHAMWGVLERIRIELVDDLNDTDKPASEDGGAV